MSQQDDERIARKLLDLGSRSDRVQIRNGMTYLDGYALGNGTVEIRSQVARDRRMRMRDQAGCRPICPEWSESVTLRQQSLSKSIETLGPKFKGGFTLNGVGTSGDNRQTGLGGSGTINYSIPEDATVCRAYLWWNTLTNLGTEANTITVNGGSLTGVKIGQGGHTCWSFSNSRETNKVYRADVTGLITGTSGSVAVSGLPDYRPNAATTDSSQGAALLIVYSSPTGECTQLHIYDGCLTMPESNLALPLEGTTISKIGFGIGDAQPFSKDLIRINGTFVANVGAGRDGPFMDAFIVDAPQGLTAPYIVQNNYIDDCLSWFLVVHAL
jgi:hypothetical protein